MIVQVTNMSAMKKPRSRKAKIRRTKARKAKPRSPVAPPTKPFVDRKKEGDRRRCREPVDGDEG